MPYSNPKPINMAFPVVGVDRSLPTQEQPNLTTYELLNVRAFPPGSDRLGGGTREGLSKLFDEDNQAGVAGNRRLTGLEVLTESTAVADPSLSSKVAVSEDWSTQSPGDRADLGAAGNWFSVATRNNIQNYGILRYGINASNQLTLDSGDTDETNHIICSHLVDQDTGVTMVMTADTQADSSNDGYGIAGQPTMVGPTIGVSNDLQTGIIAFLERVALDQVQAKIYEYSGGGQTLTQKATSTTQTLLGSGSDIQYTFTLKRVGTTVTATFAATGALSGPADLDITLTYETALTGGRGGIASPIIDDSGVADGRFIDSISLTKLVPPANTIFSSFDPTVPNPFNFDQYYLPSDFIGVSRSDTGVITLTPGGTTETSRPVYPAIDDTGDEIVLSNPGTNNSDFADEINFVLYNNTTERFGVTVRPKPAGSFSETDMGSPVFRATMDGRNALILFLDHEDSTTITDTGITFSTRIHGVAIVDNVATDLSFIFQNGGNNFFALREDSEIRCTDDGTTIRFYINGVLAWSIQGSDFFGWTQEIEDGLAGNVGVGFTGGWRALTSSLLTAEIGKSEIVQGEGGGTIQFDDTKNKLAIFSPAKIQIGDTANLVVSDVAGPSLGNPLPQAASFNRKFYAVDGVDELIINPAANTSSDWASAVTDGTLPAGTRLIASFRGSMYLAATNSDPTIWFKSRTLDPLDWDFGADPQVSSAVAGNNGEVGQPADAITALTPFSDDLLIFGMSRSLGVLEGDPGYGGQFQIVSNEAGIVGPRAFAFDDRGTLYFVGQGGLYRMFKGTFQPEPVGPRKLRRALEELDLSANLVQMAFRPDDRTMRIYITPADGETVGTHIVFDTRTEGFFLDQIPLEYGPWSIAQTSGVRDIDRNLVLGGNDGFVRRPDDAAVSDDGADITSFVEIPVPQEFEGLSESICQELQFVMGEGGAAVQWFWFTGDSAEEVRQQTVADGDFVATGVIQGTGFRPPVGIRETGAAHKIRFSATSAIDRWSLERITALLATTTVRRR